MSSSFSPDSDDEYGYDLSLEDETLLSQLITDNPAPTSSSSRNPAAPSIASDFGIDTVAEEEFRLDDAPADLLSYRTTGTAKGPARSSRSRSKATFTDDTKQADLLTATPDHSVAYPDCECYFARQASAETD